MRGHAPIAEDQLVMVTIISVFVIMLIASIVRALQRWEILPDPLLPEKLRNLWYGLQKSAVDRFASSLKGSDINRDDPPDRGA